MAESARRILDVLKQRDSKIVTLRELAQMAGFKGALYRDFKDGFMLLQKRGIVKLRQSGWRSEKRGGLIHPKSVILLANISEVEEAEAELVGEGKMRQDIGETEVSSTGEVQRLYRRRPCIDCRSFTRTGEYGSCQKYGWEMSIEVARRQELCFY